MDSKDARARLESARCRCGNGRRSAAAGILVIQGLITAAVATFSLYIFLNPRSTSTPHNKPWDNGIYMQGLDFDSDKNLKFDVIWNERAALIDQTRVNLSCAGPYMVYMWSCTAFYHEVQLVNLTMEQGGEIKYSQTLQNGCKEMQTILMLSDKSEITLKVQHSLNTIKIEKLLLGLHYMLGEQCFPSPV